MKETRLLMGMPITVEVADPGVTSDALERAFRYLAVVDEVFSTFKETSEISRFNRGELSLEELSPDMREVLALAEQTRQETRGYFDIYRAGVCDPSGIVKGWAALRAARLLEKAGYDNFYIAAGGDIQANGTNHGAPWRIGVRNPFNRAEHVKTLAVSNRGVATSGTAIRGQHIYDPHHPEAPLTESASMTVIGPNVYEADRFATAAFAMGRDGIYFIEERRGLEGYMIDAQGIATATTGLARYGI